MQIQGLVDQMHADPSLAAKIQADPMGAIKAVADASPLATDKVVYRIVVMSLGGTVILAMLGAIVLVGLGKAPPEVMGMLGSAAVGALAGLLAPSPARS